VQHDVESAEASGVTGTPTFFVGGRRHSGPFDAGTLAAALLAAAAAEGVALDEEEPPRPAPRPVPPDEPAALPELSPDLPETPDRGGDHPRLTDDQLAVLERFGTRLPVAAGEVLYRPGDSGYGFHVVLSGAVAIVGRPGPGGPTVVRVHGERRFLGALDLFGERPVVRTAVVIRAGEVLRLAVEQFRSALAADPALRDVVLRAYLVRRAIRLEMAADLRIVGRPGSPDTRRVQERAAVRSLTTDLADVGPGADGDRMLDELGVSEADLPVVVSRTGEVLHAPDDAELDRLLRTLG
jgi:CRP-like cAMP-binding protein